MDPTRSIVLALDGKNLDAHLQLVETVQSSELSGVIRAYKVGDLADEVGPGLSSILRKAGARGTWLDHKFDDIAKTVGNRARRASLNGYNLCTVMAQGGVEMMQTAVAEGPPNGIIAVTVLTSLDETQTRHLTGKSRIESVLMFAHDAVEAGVAKLVASPNEVEALCSEDGLESLEFFIPGTRSVGVAAGSQKNVRTPDFVFRIAGARATIVVASEVTEAEDPLVALENIVEQIIAV